MTTGAAPRERARAHIDALLLQIARLRSTGPNPFDYFQWADEGTNILRELFGDESDEAKAFHLAVLDTGRTIDQRGIVDNMTLGLHGPWGIWARLDRGEGVLRQILGRLG